MADVLTVHRRELRSFAARIPGALVFPLLPGPLVAVVAAGAVLALFSYGGIVGAILGYGIQWAFLFSVLRQASRGARGYEPAEVTEEGSGLVFQALRGFIGTAIVWLPAGAWFVWRLGGTRDLAAAATDPVLWLLLAAGIVYAPAALMHAAAGGRAIEMLNPVYPVSFIARLGLDYALAVGAVVLLGAIGAGLSVASLAAGAMPVPVLSRVLAQSISLLAPTAMARVLGVLLHVRGDALDHGVPADYQEPLLPGAVPRGAEPVLATTAVAEPEPAPGAGDPAAAPDPALGPGPSPEPAVAARVRAVAATAPATAAAGPAAPAAGDPAAEIARALSAGEASRAADLFEAYRGPPASIAPRGLFAIAKAASDAGRHPLAARALHAAGTGDDAAVAPNALLVLARVYERRLGRAAEARQVLEYLVGRWPGSDAAAQARTLLAPPRAT